MRKLARYTIIFIATLLLLILFWQVRVVLIAFAASVALAAMLRPNIDRLQHWGLPKSAALGVVYLLLTLILVGLGFWIGPALLEETQELASYAAVQYEWLFLTGGADQLDHSLISVLPPPDQLYSALTGEEQLPTVLLPLLRNIGTLLAAVPLVVVASLYWSVSQDHFERLWFSLLPPHARVRARDTWRATEREIGAYFRSELLQSFLTFMLLLLAYYLLGLPYPTLLGVAVALLWLIPLVGGIAAILLVVIATFGLALPLAIGAVAFTIAVLALQQYVVEPALFQTWRYNPILALLLMITLISSVGFVGLLLAPPLAALIQIFVRYWLMRRVSVSRGTTEEQMASITMRLAALRAHYDHPDSSYPQDIGNMIGRLERLLRQAQNNGKINTETSEEQKPSTGLPTSGAAATA